MGAASVEPKKLIARRSPDRLLSGPCPYGQSRNCESAIECYCELISFKEELRRRRAIFHGCDALDVAALWPSTPQLAGLPLPQVEAETRLETNARPAGRR